MEVSLSRNAAIAALCKTPHGELNEYLPLASTFAVNDSEFFGHLLAWNQAKGVVRDAKVALPIIALMAPQLHPALAENAAAALMAQSPRDFARGARWGRGIPQVTKRQLRKFVEFYLREREQSPKRFDRAVLQHKAALKELYALNHIKPGPYAEAVLFKGENIGPNALLRSLASMSDAEVAGAIAEHRIPFLTLTGTLGKRMKSEPLVLAMIDRMTHQELVTNTKMLKKLGVETSPVLRSAYREALGRTKTAAPSFKATRAAAMVSGGLGAQLTAQAERTADATQVKGDWLIIADVSGSMQHAIETARVVAGTLARAAEGKVLVMFCNAGARPYWATGKTIEQIRTETALVQAGGGTCLGIGVQAAVAAGFAPGGIALVSDGAEHSAPWLGDAYAKAAEVWGYEPPIYFYHLSGELSTLGFHSPDLELTEFDLRQSRVDYTTLPNLIQTMRTNKFSLTDEIFATPLLTLAGVLNRA